MTSDMLMGGGGQCGIYTPGGIIMQGPDFRQLPPNKMLEVVPRLQVLAWSSPEDKKLLVEKLRELGGIVGVTGDGTNDGPALKTADVGFSMCIAGTEVAMEAPDIIPWTTTSRPSSRPSCGVAA